MTKLILTQADRLEYMGQEWGYRRRHRDRTYWLCDLTQEEISFTDSEFADAMSGDPECCGLVPGSRPRLLREARLPAIIQRPEGGQPSFCVPVDARSPADHADGVRRMEYVTDARALGLHVKRIDADLSRSIQATAQRIEDVCPPKPNTLWGWLVRGGENPTTAMLATNTSGKGNRTPGLGPEVVRIMDAVIAS